MQNTIINKLQFQTFPYHLVEPSPWPIFTSFSLLTLAISAVMYFHGFNYAGQLFLVGLTLTAGGMILWFRDVIFEGTLNFFLTEFFIKNSLTRVNSSHLQKSYSDMEEINLKISEQKLEYSNKLNIDNKIELLKLFKNNLYNTNYNKEQLSYYLAGLLEGDGHISLPFLGKTSLNRILNPRFVLWLAPPPPFSH